MRAAKCLLCGVLACAIVPAYASGGYLGIGYGMGSSTDAAANVEAHAGPGGVITYNKSRPAFSVLAGYQFNRYVAAELQYVDFGTYSVNQTAVWGTYNEVDTINAASAAAVGTWPITRMFSVFAKLGLAISADKAEVASYDSSTTTATGVMFGAGGAVNFTRHIALRLEYDQYDGVGNNHYEYTAGPFTQVAASVLYMF